MAKTGTTAAPRGIVTSDDRELSDGERLQVLADALCRAAFECSHQHERAARLSSASALGAEVRLLQQMCTMADEALGELAAAYERTAARFQPEGTEPWWRRANILWLAAREYQVHHQGCDDVSRQLEHHDAGMFGELQVEYELAASALLALRHAAEAYRRTRETGS